MYLYCRILNSEDEEIFSNEEHGYASKKRKKGHFRNDTNTQCKITFINSFMVFYLLNMFDIPNCLDSAIQWNERWDRHVNDSACQCCPLTLWPTFWSTPMSYWEMAQSLGLLQKIGSPGEWSSWSWKLWDLSFEKNLI